MKKRIVATALVCSMALAGLSSVYAAESLTLGTGGTTGTYYAVGGAMTDVLNPLLDGSSLTLESSGASRATRSLPCRTG